MDIHVKISESLLETIALATVEAYVLGDRQGHNEIETFGYIWGTRTIRNNSVFFSLERGSISLSAERDQNWVRPNNRAAILKDAVVRRWSPHMSLLGHFHTHPYINRVEVGHFRGFEFSPGDFRAFINGEYFWENADNMPIMLVMTVCRLQRVHSSVYGKMIRSNVWRFDIGEYRFWLNAVAGYLDDNHVRQHTPNHSRPENDVNVLLDLSRFYNQGGDRLE